MADATLNPEQTTLLTLAAKISEQAETLTKSLKDNNVPMCDFTVDSPATYASPSPEIYMQRQGLIESLMDMIYLTQGPNESIFNYAHSAMPDAACINILNYFNFWDAVPLHGTATFQEIASHVSLPVDVVKRLVRHATTLRIFEETAPGKSTSEIRHSFRSAPLARSKGLRALLLTTLEMSGGPLMALHFALERYSKGKDHLPKNIDETAFSLLYSGGKFGTFKNTWEMLEEDGEGERKGWRQREFTVFMDYLKEIFGLEGVVKNAYDWESVGKAKVVDIGGSAGHDAITLAKSFPDLEIVVQDLPQVTPVFNANLPSELSSRVSFMAHNMFDPQPVAADIYLLKLILHDWPDEEAIKLLRALIPSLKPGARVIFIEYVGAEEDSEDAPLPRIVRGMGSATDLRVMALFNNRERPVSAWKEIFTMADERFEVRSVKSDKVAFYAVVEAVWRG
ncbi:S-adenosyl-L-methionine-dependent methyltransferase [Sporormia fimetaria CBS 119925]|uniref:S-adenosyl-L-methionine-dependent methyltransferase n=1 Tax=Sporormia fimetaria CBS 119925 TaxID=1340428 RepID=A0A6A6UYQ7_9PLEO|nr:S-adenosyl-L-methionine-dependent methyltransferase [Sporormia fimetaria CBS 119925]